MRVQRLRLPDGVVSWTVLGDDGPVQPIERYLAYLTDIERSPNTVKAYAHDLKDWFLYLAGHGRDWRSVTLEDVAGFVAWLRAQIGSRIQRVVGIVVRRDGGLVRAHTQLPLQHRHAAVIGLQRQRP